MSESLDLQALWNQQSQPAIGVDSERLHQSIGSSLKKQRRQLGQYYWSSFVYQLVIYGLAAHVAIRYWGDMKLMLMSAALILLYVPFTWIQRKRYLNLCVDGRSLTSVGDASTKDYITSQLTNLENFYRFKKWYDWLVLPVNIALMVALVFEVFVPGGVIGHWLAAVLVFVVFGSMFVLALLDENLKRFREPIRAYRNLLSDLAA